MSTVDDLPHSATCSGGRHFPLPVHDNPTSEVPNATLMTVPNTPIANHPRFPSDLKMQRAPSFSPESSLGAAQKAQNPWQSPITETVANGITKAPNDEGSNPLKRRNKGVEVDYPRGRTTIACEVCRSRKSRCNGNKPSCELCIKLGAECIYQEPSTNLNAGQKLIIERLNRIESILQMDMAHNQTNGVKSVSHSIGSGTNAMLANAASSCSASIIPSSRFGTLRNQLTMNNINIMPRVHTNGAMHLLQWPLIRDLVSRPYDPKVLLQLEMAREPLHCLTKTPFVDVANSQAYIEAYFERVNVWYACVNPYTWRSQYRTAILHGFREGPESCIVLLVLALGQASLCGSISRLASQEHPPGLQYFSAAWSLLPSMMTTTTVLAAQCHLLAAAYLFYLVRPMEAWSLLCSTSTKLQLLLISSSRVSLHQRELVERIYWNAVLFESDLLTELDLPHSGIVQFEEDVDLPSGFEPEEGEQVGGDELWYFLADIALRRLLNRVNQLIYFKDSIALTLSLDPVVAELDYQLTQWYESLPLPLQFPFTQSVLQDPVQTVLRLRFFACRTIIYRPYILAVLDNEQAILDPAVRDHCHKCLEASIHQLEHIVEYHAGHMPYLWQGALSIVSQTLLVMGATLSPSLLGILLTLVPHRENLDQIINDVVMEIEHYAVLAPSLGLIAKIIKEAELRRRTLLGERKAQRHVITLHID
ncbi:hypothetical protein S40293_10021 [Stachybotrys chartarum IBT 40293]|nr:hypothetical protein S40293_10021 [Stachybotrys chartarum IBT 40293]